MKAEQIDQKKETLQNAAQTVGLIIHKKFFEDKRKTTEMYFATKNGTCISPILPYVELNMFILGYSKATKTT